MTTLGATRTPASVPRVAGRPGRRRPAWFAPVCLLGVLGLLALLAPLLAEAPPDVLPDDLTRRGRPPSVAHPFGTDSYGRDVLGLLLYGLRVSLGIAAASVGLATALGTLWGALAATAGGRIEQAMLRLLDVLLAIPRVLVLLAVVAAWGTATPLGIALVLGATGWFDVARLVRGEVAMLRQQDWLLAARAAGVPWPRLVVHHLLPHLLPTLGVAASIGVAAAIALEAGLSYLGLGVQAPAVSLGTLLADGGGLLLVRWWMTVFPGVLVGITVLGFTTLGDALRAPTDTAQVAA